MMKLRRKGGRATCQRMRTKKKGRWGGGQDGGGGPKHSHGDGNDCEELLVAGELRATVDLLPEGQVVVLALVVVHGRSLFPVKKVEGDLRRFIDG